MADLLIEAAIGTAIEKLLGAVSRAIITGPLEFKSTLQRLKTTLERIAPTISQIDHFNKTLNRPVEEIAVLVWQLEKGGTLVRKCAKIRWWQYFHKAVYSRKLTKLEGELERFFRQDMQVLQTRDGVETLVRVRELHKKMGGGLLPESGRVPAPPAITVGLDVPLKELKMQLLQEDVGVLVLSAPGGCGKTTLAKMLCSDEEIRGIFRENILFVTVSKKPKVKIIMEKLFQHKGYSAPAFQNDEDAVNYFEDLLMSIESVPLLIVLDDVWCGAEDLLQKFEPTKVPGHKVLVTSRFTFPRFHYSYKLKLLNDEDAMTLFCYWAFPAAGSFYTPNKEILYKIMKGCKGFPLALKVVGSALRGQPAEIWQTRVMEWSAGQSIFDSDTSLLDCLQSSLDVLDKRVKDCFLDLGSFPEDQRISVSALTDMWVELYELDNDGVQAVAVLHKLAARNLVNLVLTSEVDNSYNEFYVLQHDLLRDLAIYQSNKEPMGQRRRLVMDGTGTDLSKWWKEQKQNATSARLMSISSDETFSTCYDMNLPELEVLVLNFCSDTYALPAFSEGMRKLKALVITNYSLLPANLTHFQLLWSLSSLRSIRLEQIVLPALSNTKEQLMNLRKISLVVCKIGETFNNCSTQIGNLFPNLEELHIDYCSDLICLPAGMCEHLDLKKLSITNCHMLSALPEDFGKLVNLERLSLRACTGLLALPCSIGSLNDLSFLDVSDCVCIGAVPEEMGNLRNLRKLNMRGCSSLSELPSSFEALENLEDVLCDEETASLWDSIYLPGMRLTVSKENIDLNWLYNPRF